MSSTVQVPSQVERLEGVAVAGLGAENRESTGHQLPGNISHGSVERPSSESDDAVVPKADAALEEKVPGGPQAPERSKGKIALIMGSLMVRETAFGYFKWEHR